MGCVAMRFHISIEEILGSKARLKILKHLFTAEAPMSEGELASLICVSHMTINRLMKELQALNLVYSERAGNVNIWKVNKKSYVYQILGPIISGIAKAPSPFAHLKGTLLKHLPKKMLQKVVVFGSIAAAEEKENSDIDLFIQVKDELTRNKLQIFIDKLTGVCLDFYGNKLSPYVLSERDLAKKRRALLLEIEKGAQVYP